MSRSKRSAAPPPEFFFDRSLGKVVAHELRARGWTVHLIADHYPNDAQHVPDEVWLEEGAGRGWFLLSKDEAIKRRDHEAVAVGDSLLFVLSRQDWTADEMVGVCDHHRHRIEQRIRRGVPGVYIVSRTAVTKYERPAGRSR